MPTLTRTWTNVQNQVPADQTTQEKQGAYILLALKTAFLAAGWTVTRSSNGVTADTSDNWSTYTDVAWASSGVHSWICLQSPANYASTGNRLYVALDWLASQKYQCDFYVSNADWATGTTSLIGANSGNTNTWSNGNFVPTSLSDVKYHYSTNTIGDVIFYVSNDSNSYVGFGTVINKLGEVDGSDNYGVYEYINTGANAFTSLAANYSFGGNGTFGSTGYSKGHWIDGTTTNQTAWTMNNTFMNYINGNSLVSDDDITGKKASLPIFVCSQSAGKYALRGRLVDIWAGNGTSVYNAPGSVEPSSGDIVTALAGLWWVPATVTPTF